MKKPKLPIIVIAGPTASGKSAVAVELAKKINGEILCANSSTIYKDVSVGTAKPTAKQQARVKHYGIDLVNLGESFTAYDFQLYGKKTIKKIRDKNKVPIIVGGSGLYIDGLVYGFSFRPIPNSATRSKLNNLNVSELQNIIINQKLSIPENSKNKRHLIRVVETKGLKPSKHKLPHDVIYTGMLPKDDTIKAAINQRVESMYKNDFLIEITKLKRVYSPKQIASAGIGYQSAIDCVNGKLGHEEAKQLFKRGDWQLARRQKTWFKRNPDIAWFEDKNKLQTHILSLLNK